METRLGSHVPAAAAALLFGTVDPGIGLGAECMALFLFCTEPLEGGGDTNEDGEGAAGVVGIK